MNTITCPQCGEIVQIDEAFKHQIGQQVLKEYESKHKDDLEKAKLVLKKEIEDEMAFKMKDSANELEESKKRNRELQEQLLDMSKSIRELKEQDERRELDSQKKLAEEREKIKEEVSKFESEKSNLKLLELTKQLDDTKKLLEDAQRKAEQKSQQMQGEVLELDLEQQLHDNFQTDEILPVPKGIEGGDIWQKVRNRLGQTGGSILWETKQTKAFSKAWVSKLREDKRQVGANVAILVTTVLPEGIQTFGMYENVWVTCYEYAIPLAQVLRNGILEVAIAKSAAANKDEKLEALYNYLTNDGFRHRFEAQVESIIELKNDLDAEQRSMIRAWKKREVQINRMRNSIATMYGELQGIIGQALPTLPSLETPQLTGQQTQKNLLEE